MSRVRSLVAVALCAAATLGLRAAPADATPEPRARATAPVNGVVTSIAVRPAAGRAEVFVAFDGAARMQDFTLRSPDKIVVDITGLSMGVPARGYDRIARGGIVYVRWSQYRRNVVRVVLTLDRKRAYTVERSEGGITIAVQSDSAAFAAWTVGAERMVAVADTKVAPEAPPEAPRKPDPVIPRGAEPKPQADQQALTAPEYETLSDVQVQGTVITSAPRESAAQPRNVAMASTNRERPVMQQRIQQPRISVAWSNADIREVLAQFAAFSGRTIIVGRGVSATITAEIIDQPWDVAMAAILASQGLAATEDVSGIIVVDTYQNIAARRTSEPLATRTIRLNYSRAFSAAENLRQRLSRDCASRSPVTGGTRPNTPMTEGATSETTISNDPSCPVRGAVTADSLTNSISITDVPGALPGLLEYARSLDIRQPQVSIKAKIILVDRNSFEALGLKYDIGTRDNFFNTLLPRLDSTGSPLSGGGQFILGGNALAAIGNANQTVASPALSLIYSAALGRYDFTTFLDALQETSLLDVQSEPSVVTLNNRTARLQAGTDVPVRTIEAGAGGGEGNLFPTATVETRPVGIILEVTPQITANRQIIMRVLAENSDVALGPGDIGAVFPTQSVRNEMLVSDGETAVMGGLTQTRVNVTKSGIPFLVDLPLIGRLFGTTQRQETKRDLLILITPHIVDEGQALPESPDDR